MIYCEIFTLPPARLGQIFLTYIYYIMRAQSCLILLQSHRLKPARLLSPWDFPGKNTGVGYHFLDLSDPRIEPVSLALLADSIPLSHQGVHV